MSMLRIFSAFSLSNRSILFLRAAWLMYLAYSMLIFISSGWGYADQMRFNRAYANTFFYFSQWISFPEFQGMVNAIFSFLAIFYLLVSIFVFVRKSNETIGILTSISLMGVPNSYFWGSEAIPYEIFAFLESLLTLVWVYAFSQLLFIFPDGCSLPRDSGRVLRVSFLIFILAMILTYVNEIFFAIPLIGIALLNIAGISSQIYRYYRISTIPEKQQTKWVFFSLLFLVLWVLFRMIDPGGSLRFEAGAFYGLFVVLTGFIVVFMIPVAFTFSILRYRLFDIDLVIRRTLQYGLLSGLLLGIYLGMVIVLQAAFRTLTGEENSPLITVVSTLLIAALFNPLRRRIQDLINRRFYRAAYNAEKILEDFAHAARDEVDIDLLADSIIEVAEQAMQPKRAILLIKKGP